MPHLMFSGEEFWSTRPRTLPVYMRQLYVAGFGHWGLTKPQESELYLYTPPAQNLIQLYNLDYDDVLYKYKMT